MHICSGLVGPKSGNVEKVLVSSLFQGPKKRTVIQDCEQASEPEHFLVEKVCKKQQKEEKAACRSEMASMMRACAGLVGPKSENVDFSLVLQWFLKGQRSEK